MADETPETTPDEEPAAEATEAPEAAVETEAPAAEPEAPAGPDPSLSPSDRRAWHRQRSGTTAKPQRSPEERHEERQALRAKKAVARRRRRLQEREKRVAQPEHPRAGTPAAESEPGRVQLRQGVVVSAKGDKTLAIRIDSAKRHPKYKKIVRSSTKIYAHDERNDAGEGDTVRVRSSRPLSRTKRWLLVDVVERAK